MLSLSTYSQYKAGTKGGRNRGLRLRRRFIDRFTATVTSLPDSLLSWQALRLLPPRHDHLHVELNNVKLLIFDQNRNLLVHSRALP